VPRYEPTTTNQARVISTSTGGNKIAGTGKEKTTARAINPTREETAGFEEIADPYSRYAPVEGDHDHRWDDC